MNSLRVSQILLLIFKVLGSVDASDLELPVYPSELTIKVGYIPTDSFGGFQRDLLLRLEELALEDNVSLNFEVKELQELYGDNLVLISPECHSGETRTVRDVEYQCSDYDIIVGDYWPNPSRYELVEFTPAWLTTAVSAMKLTEKKKYPHLDVTTLSQASRTGAAVCTMESSYVERIVKEVYPDVNIVYCAPNDEEDGCVNMLMKEECFLLVSDELVLRRTQAETPNVEVTGEKLDRQLLAWPFRKDIDPTMAFLLNKWMYAAISSRVIDDLYFEYFEKKLCPIGTAGKDCELPCDPDHGMADATGACICESIRWTEDDCSVEILEDLNMIPPTVKIISYAMFACNAAVIFVCGIWLWVHRESAQVRSSQPAFLILVLLGCLVSSSAILVMIQEHEDDGPVPACAAIPWLYSVGFSITFGTLFAKIRRVYTIFVEGSSTSAGGTAIWSQSRRRDPKIKDTVFFIGTILLLDVIILVTWTLVAPLHWERDIIREDQFGYPLESQGYCTSEYWRAFIGVLIALHISLCAVASWMCYAARHIPSRYSEHQYVTIAMISNLQIFLIGVPVLVIAGDDPAASSFVRSVVVWMNDLVVVGLIFGNLMFSVYRSVNLTDTDNAVVVKAIRGLSNQPALSVSGKSPKDDHSIGTSDSRLKRNGNCDLESKDDDDETAAQGKSASPATRTPLQQFPPLPPVSSLTQDSSSTLRPSRSVTFRNSVYVSEISTNDFEAGEGNGSLPSSLHREPLAESPDISRRHSLDSYLPQSTARWCSLSVSSSCNREGAEVIEEKRRSAPRLPNRPPSSSEPVSDDDHVFIEVMPPTPEIKNQKIPDGGIDTSSGITAQNSAQKSFSPAGIAPSDSDGLRMPERLTSIVELDDDDGEYASQPKNGSKSSFTTERKERAPVKPERIDSEHEDHGTKSTVDDTYSEVRSPKKDE